MIDTATLALSACTTGVAVSGFMMTIRGIKHESWRLYLALIFMLFAGMSLLPLVITFIPGLYVFYIPAVLPMLLTVPPAVYRFVVARTSEGDAITFQMRDGLLPLAGLLVAFGYWLLPETPRATMLVDGELPSGFMPITLAVSTLGLIACWSIISIGYLAGTIKALREFRQKLKNSYSNTETHELRWIDWLMVFLIALWSAATISLTSENIRQSPLISVQFVFVFTALLLLFLIAFISVTPSIENFETSNEEQVDNNKYARSALSIEHAKRLAKRIDVAMREDELYLDANLSLVKLSRHISALPNMVSQTLNEEIASTFYDYVAHWRISAAKPLILEGSTSILDVSLDVGFNSRSTFYKAFKRETGMTPKAFRQKGNAGNL